MNRSCGKLCWLALAGLMLWAGCAEESSGNTGGAGTGDGVPAPGTGNPPPAPTPGEPTANPPPPPLQLCDETYVSPTECGGVTCPAADPNLSMGCVRTCCTAQNECGTLVAAQGIPQTICEPPAVEDVDCPSFSFGQISFPGCCRQQEDRCGLSVGICLDVATALQGFLASNPGAGPDAGLDGGMPDAGLGIDLPVPTDCSGNPVTP